MELLPEKSPVLGIVAAVFVGVLGDHHGNYNHLEPLTTTIPVDRTPWSISALHHLTLFICEPTGLASLIRPSSYDLAAAKEELQLPPTTQHPISAAVSAEWAVNSRVSILPNPRGVARAYTCWVGLLRAGASDTAGSAHMQPRRYRR